MTTHYPFSSTIVGKTILLIEPGNTLFTTNFTGLGFESTTPYEKVYTNEDFQKHQNTHFDVIMIHGFLLRRLEDVYDLDKLKTLNITCDIFLVDYLGEGYSLDYEITKIKEYTSNLFKPNKVKVLTPIDSGFNNDDNIYDDIDLFKYPMAGPRAFCGRFNQMLHINEYSDSYYEVFSGLEWTDTSREYSFMCLNNREGLHRNLLVNHLVEKNLTEDNLVSCRFGNNDTRVYDFNSPIGFRQKKIFRPNIQIPVDKVYDSEFRFGPNNHISKKCYIDVVTETSFENPMFITEKSMKPFFNLQFSVIFGPIGIIKKLREFGFDMFDDIINHSYDEMEFKLSPRDGDYSPKLNYFILEKSKVIADEVERLSKLDLENLLKSNKERLIYNRNLASKICIDDNTLLIDVGKWVFGNSISFNIDNNFIKKLY